MTDKDAKKFLEYDNMASPLFEGLFLKFSEEEIKKSGNTDIFPGAYLYKAVGTFIRLYHAKCKDFGVELHQIKRIELETMVPYCPAFSPAMLIDDMIAAMMYMSDHFGKYEELITDNIVKTDRMSSVIKQLEEEPGLRDLFASYADVMITADKIIMLDYSLGAMVIDKKWQEIADVLNEYVDKLNIAHFTKELEHFTKDDIMELSKLSGLTIEPTKIEENGKWGLVDVFGQTVLPCEWNYIDEFHEGFAVVADKNNKAGYVNARGELVIPCIWNLALGFEGGFAVVSDDENKYGIINKKGEIVIPCKWRFATPFENGLAKVQNFDEHWFVIDPDGKTTRVYTYSERKAMRMLTKEEVATESQAQPSFPPFTRFDEIEDPGPF